ncbi:MAG: hypothetical protein IKT98_04045 [Selenomonadaceae bacterium]|nr:hypothetical protein [Selenomonadaceae bacterium]
MNSIKRFLVTFLATFLILNLSWGLMVSAQQFSAEGEYRLGDRDTREDAKKFAIAEAKRKIIEQAGVYVESFTEVRDFKFGQDKIKIIAQGIVTIKDEQTEFSENGVLCKAYVTAAIDTDSMKKELLKLIKESKDAEQREYNRREKEDRSVRIDKVESNMVTPMPNSLKELKPIEIPDTSKYAVPTDLSGILAELEEARAKMIEDLSKATAYTAGSEYKLQEVTGIMEVSYNHSEKGEISSYLKENPEMYKNYRFAELTPFVELAGADKIMLILEDINKKKLADAKDRMKWAKIERARAKSYGEIVIKEAGEVFKRAEILMIDANDKDRAHLKTIRTEADDAIKLIHALEARNKAVDEVAKKYEKANKITAKDDKYNPKKKKNIFKELISKIM